MAKFFRASVFFGTPTPVFLPRQLFGCAHYSGSPKGLGTRPRISSVMAVAYLEADYSLVPGRSDAGFMFQFCFCTWAA
jgi:hypothetical protein